LSTPPPDPSQPGYVPPPPSFPQTPPAGSYPPPPPAGSYPPPGGAYPPPPPPPGGYPPVPTGGGLPPGVELASAGRRIGAYFLAIPLSIITLGIGYIIWGAVVWGKGTSPALQVLGMRVWRPAEGRPASWGQMALRNIIGGIVEGICIIIGIVSFVFLLSKPDRATIHDKIGGTIVVHDPNKVLG
jgi:uncharacterized RDD family membrane protein YckC